MNVFLQFCVFFVTTTFEVSEKKTIFIVFFFSLKQFHVFHPAVMTGFHKAGEFEL